MHSHVVNGTAAALNYYYLQNVRTCHCGRFKIHHTYYDVAVAIIRSHVIDDCRLSTTSVRRQSNNNKSTMADEKDVSRPFMRTEIQHFGGGDAFESNILK